MRLIFTLLLIGQASIAALPLASTCQATLDIVKNQNTGIRLLALTPYHGNKVALLSNEKWILATVSPVALSLDNVSDGLYSAFVGLEKGEMVLSLAESPLKKIDGVFVKVDDVSRRLVATVQVKGDEIEIGSQSCGR